MIEKSGICEKELKPKSSINLIKIKPVQGILKTRLYLQTI